MAWSIFSDGGSVTPAAFAKAVLTDIGAPQTAANIQSLIAQMLLEGGGGEYNPLNTTLRTSASSGSINSVGVQNYSSAAGGATATAQTLQGYPGIVAGLKAGTGYDTSAVSSELSKWSGGGYSSLGSDFAQAAQYVTGGGTVGSATTAADSSSGNSLFSLPAEITGFFSDADKFVTLLMWLVNPASWVRIGAFIVGVALLLFALHALIAVGEGEPIFPSAPPVMPVPVPV